MRTTSIAAILMALTLPAAALAGPEGTYHVKGVNPGDGRDYTGTVKIVRKGEVYRVVWQIGDDKTVGMGLGLRLVDGRMVAGPAGDADTGIAISYISGDSVGNATYTEFSDGTWRGVWAGKGNKTISTEEWIPTVRQIKVKSYSAVRSTANALKRPEPDMQAVEIDDAKVEPAPVRVLSSPMPASASPKS
jgi:hypothetical protein